MDSYFKRIGYYGSREVCAETLRQLQWHHLLAIPYEVLDIHMGCKIDLEPEIVERKIVGNGRGGYCYEQNTLFLHVLRALGFQVKCVTARARWQKPEDLMSGNIHLVLIVDVDDKKWLADVGFSACGSPYPLTFDTDEVQLTPLESRRIIQKDGLYLEQLLAGDKWLDVMVFTLGESFPMDWEIGSYYWSTHHTSLAVQNIIVSIPTKDRRYRLLNKELNTRYIDGTVENRIITSQEEYIAILRNIFNLDVPIGSRVCSPNMEW